MTFMREKAFKDEVTEIEQNEPINTEDKIFNMGVLLHLADKERKIS